MSSAVFELRALLGLPLAAGVTRTSSWSQRGLAGRLVELSSAPGSAVLTASVALMLDAQREGELVAWLGPRERLFFPPDLAASGLDLEALLVVSTPNTSASARAAERLLKSGAFGLVLLDLGVNDRIPMPLQSRLVGLAQKHDAAVVCLTHKPASESSLGSLVSLRAEVKRRWAGQATFCCELNALKDKRQGPGWSHRETYLGPPGLR